MREAIDNEVEPERRQQVKDAVLKKPKSQKAAKKPAAEGSSSDAAPNPDNDAKKSAAEGSSGDTAPNPDNDAKKSATEGSSGDAVPNPDDDAPTVVGENQIGGQAQTGQAESSSLAEGGIKMMPSVGTFKGPLPGTTAATGGQKRKHDETTGGSEANNLELRDDIDIPAGATMDSCDVVRRKIRRFIESGAMKVGEFCDAINVSNKSYNNFLGQNGPNKGVETATYQNAWEFFEKREIAGLKMPKKPKLQTEDGKAKDNVTPDLSDIHLEGEETDSVEVLDTCADVRRKITAYLKRPGVTQAQFLRDLHAQFHTDRALSRIQSSQLNSFRGKKGVDGGNTSSVFYAAYVFFEKLRIKEGKAKGKHRQEMEEIYAGKGGFDTHTAVKRYVCISLNVWISCHADFCLQDHCPRWFRCWHGLVRANVYLLIWWVETWWFSLLRQSFGLCPEADVE